MFIRLEASFVEQTSLVQQARGSAMVVWGGVRSIPKFGGKDPLSQHGLWCTRYGSYLARKLFDASELQHFVIVFGGGALSKRVFC
jgi:hypothetical protein